MRAREKRGRECVVSILFDFAGESPSKNAVNVKFDDFADSQAIGWLQSSVPQ